MEQMILTLAKELGRSEEHVKNVITLIDEGATIPFIARYRKELHGSMDDQLLRTLADRLQYLRNLEQRKNEVKNSIENQGKLTEELVAAIDAAATLAEVEDLYRLLQPNGRGDICWKTVLRNVQHQRYSNEMVWQRRIQNKARTY